MYVFLRFYLLFLESGKGREKEWERNIDVWERDRLIASPHTPAGHLAHNPGMWPDGESNWQAFDPQHNIQSTEPHQPGLLYIFKWVIKEAIIKYKISELISDRVRTWTWDFYLPVNTHHCHSMGGLVVIGSKLIQGNPCICCWFWTLKMSWCYRQRNWNMRGDPQNTESSSGHGPFITQASPARWVF